MAFFVGYRIMDSLTFHVHFLLLKNEGMVYHTERDVWKMTNPLTVKSKLNVL